MKLLYGDLYWLDDDHQPHPVTTEAEYHRCWDRDLRRVAVSEVGDIRVSTVFLGLDHGYNGPPVLFETMTFGEPYEQHCWRWLSWSEAESGHAAIVAALTNGTDPDKVESPA